MQIPKPSDEAKAQFRALIPAAPGVEVKAMFGNLGAFVNGNMFAGLFGDSLGVKLLDLSSRDELTAIEGTGPYGPVERPMGGYIALPTDWASTLSATASWVERAMLEVSALPPKKAKARK
ncbi:MAG: TfoX/Sxy family protein [Actinomycetota bacterium]|nr:TfoX/Sxy family protein [Actinomycetota bacterium]